MNNTNKCHEFAETEGKYFCKYCGIDSLTAEKENLSKYEKGIVYAYSKDNMIGGFADRICNAYFGNTWRSCFGDIRQSVYFTFQGFKYYGIYYKSGSDIIRYRKIK